MFFVDIQTKILHFRIGITRFDNSIRIGSKSDSQRSLEPKRSKKKEVLRLIRKEYRASVIPKALKKENIKNREN